MWAWLEEFGQGWPGLDWSPALVSMLNNHYLKPRHVSMLVTQSREARESLILASPARGHIHLSLSSVPPADLRLSLAAEARGALPGGGNRAF